MAHTCCNPSKEHSSHALVRATFLLALGLVLTIPICEAFLLGGVLGSICWWMLSGFIVYTIHQDFADNQIYAIGMTGVLLYLVSIPLLGQIWVFPMIVSGVLLMMGILCCNPAYFSNTSDEVLPWMFPTTERVVLLFVMLHWSLSLTHFLPITLFVYPFAIHDGLMALGLYSITQSIKQGLHRHDTIPWFHQQKVYLQSGVEKSVIELKKDDIVDINTPLHMPVTTQVYDGSTATFMDDRKEEQKEANAGTKLSANITIKSGLVRCTQDYPSMAPKGVVSNDQALRLFMIVALGVALASGIWFGISSASLSIGLEQFCLNVLVCCPCVFLIVEPITVSKFSAWLRKIPEVMMRAMPNLSRVDFMVIDRTNTTYVAQGNEESYGLHESAKMMLKAFQKQGIKSYIISGHDNEQRLQTCREELGNLVHDVRFYCEGKKHEIVRNLQLYGQLDEPTNPWLTRLIRGYAPYKVGVIGDGDNDVKAMECADFSLGIGYNPNVRQKAHFSMPIEQMKHAPSLLQAVTQTIYLQQLFYTGAFLSIACLVVLVNSGVAIPHTWICIASYATCTLLLASVVHSSVGDAQHIPQDCLPSGSQCFRHPNQKICGTCVENSCNKAPHHVVCEQ